MNPSPILPILLTFVRFGAVSCSRSSGAYSLLSRAALAWEQLPKSQIWTVPQASQGSFPSRTDIVRKFLLFSPLPIRLIPHRGRSSPRGSGYRSAPPYTPLGRIKIGGFVLPADAVFGAVSCSRSSGAFSLLSRAALAWELLPKSQIWTVPQASGAELSCAGRDCLEIPTLSTLPPACIRHRRRQAPRPAYTTPLE